MPDAPTIREHLRAMSLHLGLLAELAKGHPARSAVDEIAKHQVAALALLGNAPDPERAP